METSERAKEYMQRYFEENCQKNKERMISSVQISGQQFENADCINPNLGLSRIQNCKRTVFDSSDKLPAGAAEASSKMKGLR